ncbi:MAG: hypothetical protein RMI83_02340 [Desulfurococcaceae archaeon]|nr:hypothetical protein [Sulfolobales archaeon]MDW8169925.1 hypothetical protein [Desulfurococcaceae archaeon]
MHSLPKLASSSLNAGTALINLNEERIVVSIMSCKLFPNAVFSELLNEVNSLVTDSTIVALVPQSLTPPLEAVIVASLYALRRRKHVKKIRNPALLLLKILYAKKQINEVIDLLTSHLSSEVSLIIITSQDSYAEVSSRVLDICSKYAVCQYRKREELSLEERAVLIKNLLTAINKVYLQEL